MGRDCLSQTRELITRAQSGLDVGTKLYTGDVVGSLVESSRNATLMVLGSRGLGGASGILAGSNAVALVAHGKCPVAVIRGRDEGQAPPGPGPVVLGVDGT